MAKKEKEFLNKNEIDEMKKQAFIEYNYGDSHKITPIIQKNIVKCISECNKELGHEVDLLDFIRSISYASYSLFLHESEHDLKDLTREQMTFITEYASNSVNTYLEEYMKNFDNINRSIIMQFPFLTLDATAYKIFSVAKALEIEKEKNNK